MSVLGNIIWLVFGGLCIAIEYFLSSIVMFASIVGIPFGIQTVKLGVLALWPFGSKVEKRAVSAPSGCLYTIMNVLWFFVGGIWICLSHVAWGLLLTRNNFV